MLMRRRCAWGRGPVPAIYIIESECHRHLSQTPPTHLAACYWCFSLPLLLPLSSCFCCFLHQVPNMSSTASTTGVFSRRRHLGGVLITVGGQWLFNPNKWDSLRIFALPLIFLQLLPPPPSFESIAINRFPPLGRRSQKLQWVKELLLERWFQEPWQCWIWISDTRELRRRPTLFLVYGD